MIACIFCKPPWCYRVTLTVCDADASAYTPRLVVYVRSMFTLPRGQLCVVALRLLSFECLLTFNKFQTGQNSTLPNQREENSRNIR